MAGGSRGHQNASIGYQKPVSEDYGGKQISSCEYRVRQGEQSNFHQKTSRASYVDKQTGNYTRATSKEVVSTGETFKERSTGRVGYKNEYKTTSTYRVGDKCGYTEYQQEERFRRVDYGGCSSDKKGNYSVGSYQNGGGAAINYKDCYKKDHESEGDDGGEDYSYGGDYDYDGYDETNYY